MQLMEGYIWELCEYKKLPPEDFNFGYFRSYWNRPCVFENMPKFNSSAILEFSSFY